MYVEFVDWEDHRLIKACQISAIPHLDDYVAFDEEDARRFYGGYRIQRVVIIPDQDKAIITIRRAARV